MVIVRTYFERKDIQDEHAINQIDHILIEINVRFYRDFNSNTDHFMLRVRMAQIVEVLKKTKSGRNRCRRTIRIRSGECHGHDRAIGKYR